MGVTSVLERSPVRGARLTNSLVIAVPAAAAFAMTLPDVGRSSMYGTEAVTLYAAHLPFPQLLHLLSHVDAVHGAYYFVMHFVLMIHSSTFVLRLPSVLAMAFASGATAHLARRLTGSSRAGLFAGLALAIAPLTSIYGQSGRSYAIDTAAAVVTWWLFLNAVEKPTRQAGWRWYTIAVALTAYFHEMTLLVIGASIVTLAWSRTAREVWQRWLRATAWAILLSVPVLVSSIVQNRQVSWIKPATLQTVRYTYQDFLGPGMTALWINLALIVIGVAVALRWETPRPGITLTRLALPIFVVAPMLLIVESMVATPLYGGVRYVIWALPAMAMLIGTGLDDVARVAFPGRLRTLGLVLGIALLVFSLSSQWTYQRLIHSAKGMPQDMLAAASYLKHNSHPGDGVLFAGRSFYALRLGYPADLRNLDDLVIGESGKAGGRLYGTDKSGRAITKSVDAAGRIWVVGTADYAHSNHAEFVALRKHFKRVSTFRATGEIVSLYIRSA